uniref:RNA binding PUA domain protein n=1 Tax=Caldiarchaeum subterraneum TaxID=311458 RepID=E6N9V4_CALS0|nr:RNA binding PUA domain protein [Candidatus Caldarchaeum subterraneum]
MSFDEFLLRQVRQLASFQFGVAGEMFIPDGCVVELSPSTGRPRRIWLDGKCIATIRAMDGWLTLTVFGAQRLNSLLERGRNRVVVNREGAEKVAAGYDVYGGHVVEADASIVPGTEVLVVDEDYRLLGVGKAVVAGVEMTELRRGAVVKVRHKV